MQVSIWSDVVCPFCYIGKKRLEAVAAEMGVPLTITWYSFELDPNAPASYPFGLVDHISKKYRLSPEQAVQSQQRIAAAAAEEGIQFNWQAARPGNTFNAHRLIHLAAEHGLANEAEEAFFRAYMTEGELISDKTTLARIALDLGLPSEAVAQVLNSDQYTKAVRDDEAVARQQLNITGVPFFIFNNRLILSGAQPREVFRQAIEQAADVPAQNSMSSNTSDAANAGLCNDEYCELPPER